MTLQIQEKSVSLHFKSKRGFKEPANKPAEMQKMISVAVQTSVDNLSIKRDSDFKKVCCGFLGVNFCHSVVILRRNICPKADLQQEKKRINPVDAMRQHRRPLVFSYSGKGRVYSVK